ncbi:MAG: hypothetical protein KJO06_06425 [Gemmatimonadetes bacterium]|nr:hypothetical protein [Gemmatimonadota bacterium]
MANKTQWRRILLEGGVIVLSILLAFAVDAGWDERQDQQAVRVHLSALAAELGTQAEDAQAGIERRELRMTVMSALVAASSPDPTSPPSSDSLNSMIGVLWGAWDPLPPLASLDNLHESGAFPAIRSNVLRLSLAQLERAIDQAAGHDERVLRSWEDGLRPYLVSRSDVRPQVKARPFELMGYEGVFALDPAELLTDPEFQNHLIVRMNRTASALVAGNEVVARLEAAAALVEEELAN